MPGKLADCQSNDITKTELFLVEGDLRVDQLNKVEIENFRLFYLSWKILNTFVENKNNQQMEKSILKMLSSNEIVTLINAIGTGVDPFD